MTHTVSDGQLINETGHFPTGELQILDSGWVYAQETDKYYSPEICETIRVGYND